MPAYRYFVIGAGGVGPAIPWWLLQRQDTERVVVADADYGRAAKAVARIATKDDQRIARCSPVTMDVSFNGSGGRGYRFLEPSFRGFNVVISAAPAAFSPGIAQAAALAGAHFCDLGGVLNSTMLLHSMHQSHKTFANTAAVPDCGLMPGLGNMMAQHLVTEMDGADDVTIYVGGLPQRPEAPHNYQRIFSLEGLRHILEKSSVLRNGDIVGAAPYSELEVLDVPALHRFGTPFGGSVEAFITAGAGTGPWWFRDQGVKNFCEKTVRWPGFAQFMRSIPQREIVQRLERILPPTDAQHPDFVWMRVIATKGDRQRQWELLDPYDPALGLSAMARTTGFSAAAVALALAQGMVSPGVHAPEQLGPATIGSCLASLTPALKL